MLGVNIPTDIRWERIAFSESRDDIDVTDLDFPKKWQPSLALYRYTPEEEYQVYPGRTIVYLKLAVSLTGYQSEDAEIEGILQDWDEFSETIFDPAEGLQTDGAVVRENLEAMLDAYRPCTGALLQVVVGSPPGWTPDVASPSYRVHLVVGEPIRDIETEGTIEAYGNRRLRTYERVGDDGEDKGPTASVEDQLDDCITFDGRISVEEGTAEVAFLLDDCPVPEGGRTAERPFSLVCYEVVEEEDRTIERIYDSSSAVLGDGDHTLRVDVPTVNPIDLTPAEQPYVMDFQPKRRALYDTVSTTNEQMSRSLESLNIRKAAGATESSEVLDVDMGESTSYGGNIGGEGGGIGGSYSTSKQGTWGTKDLTSKESTRIETTDAARERREGLSHTTHLSQLNHLLDSYHAGTNRALFFVLPRPYVNEVASGFVRGPRGIDGVQEFFVIVNQPNELDEACVAVRLDSAHYRIHGTSDREHAEYEGERIVAEEPPEDSLYATGEYDVVANQSYDVRVMFAWYENEKSYHYRWRPENEGFEGYKIDVSNGAGYDIADSSGERTIEVDQEGRYIDITYVATTRIRVYSHYTPFGNKHREPFGEIFAKNYVAKLRSSSNWQKRTITRDGYVRVNIHLISEEKTIGPDAERDLLVTTHGIKHCQSETALSLPAKTSIKKQLPVDSYRVPGRVFSGVPESADIDLPEPRVGMTLQEANYLGGAFTRQKLLEGSGRRHRERRSADSLGGSEQFVTDLYNRLMRTERGSRLLTQSIDDAGSDRLKAITDALGADVSTLERGVVVTTPTARLARRTGLDAEEINRTKLALMGIPVANVSVPPFSPMNRDEESTGVGRLESPLDRVSTAGGGGMAFVEDESFKNDLREALLEADEIDPDRVEALVEDMEKSRPFVSRIFDPDSGFEAGQTAPPTSDIAQETKADRKSRRDDKAGGGGADEGTGE